MTSKKIQLTAEQRTWLEALLLKFDEGKTSSVRSLRIELLGRVPLTFDPYKIDHRLAKDAKEILLLPSATQPSNN